jgi:hypothetical protein
MPWQQEAIDSEEEQIMGIAHGGTNDRSSMLSTPQHTTTSTRDSAISAPSPSLPDRVIVMARAPKDDTCCVQELHDR